MKLSAPVASADAAATGLSLRAALNVDVGLVARPEVSNIDGDVAYFGGRVGREVEHLSCENVSKRLHSEMQCKACFSMLNFIAATQKADALPQWRRNRC